MKKITFPTISQARRIEYNDDTPHNQAWNIQGQTGNRESLRIYFFKAFWEVE
jgi:hypothetical protein